MSFARIERYRLRPLNSNLHSSSSLDKDRRGVSPGSVFSDRIFFMERLK